MIASAASAVSVSRHGDTRLDNIHLPLDVDEPLVSIAMPVRNNERTLALAVRSLLEQTYRNWELILIDDGSTDGTLRAARAFGDPRIRVLSDGYALGLPARLNEAVDASRGVFIARMDGDDIAYPTRLDKQVRYLQQHPDVDLVGAAVLVFGPDGEPLGKRSVPEHHAEICARPYRGFAMAHPTFLGRRAFFVEHRYATSAVRCEDQDLLLRVYRRARFANVPEILLGYREEHLDLQKISTSRRYFARSLFREFSRNGQIPLAMRAAAEQGMKMAMDSIAVRSGMKYRLLRHRAQPVSGSEQQDWGRVWTQLGALHAATAL